MTKMTMIEALKKLEELNAEPLYHEFRIVGIEAREFTVRSGSQTSARINVPAEWIGKKVMLVRLE